MHISMCLFEYVSICHGLSGRMKKCLKLFSGSVFCSYCQARKKRHVLMWAWNDLMYGQYVRVCVVFVCECFYLFVNVSIWKSFFLYQTHWEPIFRLGKNKYRGKVAPWGPDNPLLFYTVVLPIAIFAVCVCVWGGGGWRGQSTLY